MYWCMKETDPNYREGGRLKTISLTPRVHSRMKIYVTKKGMKILTWVERVIVSAMEKGE